MSILTAALAGPHSWATWHAHRQGPAGATPPASQAGADSRHPRSVLLPGAGGAFAAAQPAWPQFQGQGFGWPLARMQSFVLKPAASVPELLRPHADAAVAPGVELVVLPSPEDPYVRFNATLLMDADCAGLRLSISQRYAAKPHACRVLVEVWERPIPNGFYRLLGCMACTGMPESTTPTPLEHLDLQPAAPHGQARQLFLLADVPPPLAASGLALHVWRVPSTQPQEAAAPCDRPTRTAQASWADGQARVQLDPPATREGGWLVGVWPPSQAAAASPEGGACFVALAPEGWQPKLGPGWSGA